MHWVTAHGWKRAIYRDSIQFKYEFTLLFCLWSFSKNKTLAGNTHRRATGKMSGVSGVSYIINTNLPEDRAPIFYRNIIPWGISAPSLQAPPLHPYINEADLSDCILLGDQHLTNFPFRISHQPETGSRAFVLPCFWRHAWASAPAGAHRHQENILFGGC